MFKGKFLLLESNVMSFYTMGDFAGIDTVKVFHSSKVSKYTLCSFLFKLHNSGRIDRYITLPFRGVWGNILFGSLFKSFRPDYVVMTTPWYSSGLLSYFRRRMPGCKVILRFTDTVDRTYDSYSTEQIKNFSAIFDNVLVYSKDDAQKYGFTYCSVGYSKTPERMLNKLDKQYDVVFIGADKGRLNKIRQAYNIFRKVGLTCYFYVTGVPSQDRTDDGIIYANDNMSFIDYLSYEVASKCIFELIQEGSTGRTYRLIESVIYNKLLITNCPEVLALPYYNKGYIQYFTNVSDIDPAFVDRRRVDYDYQGDFSPIHILELIENL